MTRPRQNLGASEIRTRDLPISRRTPLPLGQRGGDGGGKLGGGGRKKETTTITTTTITKRQNGKKKKKKTSFRSMSCDRNYVIDYQGLQGFPWFRGYSLQGSNCTGWQNLWPPSIKFDHGSTSWLSCLFDCCSVACGCRDRCGRTGLSCLFDCCNIACGFETDVGETEKHSPTSVSTATSDAATIEHRQDNQDVLPWSNLIEHSLQRSHCTGWQNAGRLSQYGGIPASKIGK